MTTHVFEPTVSDDLLLDKTALGTPSPKYTEAEINKAVTLGTDQNFVLCTNDQPIHGFVRVVEPFTVNGGAAFGAIQRRGRIAAEVAATYTVSVGTNVVAAAQAAVGTSGRALVRPETLTAGVSNAGAYVWKVIRIISGNGGAGSVVLLERQ